MRGRATRPKLRKGDGLWVAAGTGRVYAKRMQLSGKRIAITGVGGFIGLRMVSRARELGMQVVGLDLDPRAARRASERGADVVVGDICDPDAVARITRGADVVFHTAAVVAEDGPMDLYQRVNVQGTRVVAETARACGVKRFVHLSSVMVYGFDYPRNVSEEGPFRGEHNPYCQTKIESDALALALHEPGRFEVTVIRPGDVYGPGCQSWVVRPVQLIKSGLFALADGGNGIMNHVHVDNLLDAVFLSLERDVSGRAFNVTDGAETSFAEFFGHYARMLHKPRLRVLPTALLLPAFSLLHTGFRVLGLTPPVSPAAVRFVQRKQPYSIARAQRELGYVPRVSLEQGMRELEVWLRAEALI